MNFLQAYPPIKPVIIMKIGIISDIHGDVISLKKALGILNQHHVDKVVCAGDLVAGGIEADAVASLLRSLDIPCVQGNHDRDAFTDQALLRRQLKRVGVTEHDHLLDSATVGYVTSLPLTYEFESLNHKICVAHGTPENNMTYLFPESDLERFERAVRHTDANIIILGHTHVPMYIEYDDKVIVNAGSVYENRFHEIRTCGILDITDLSLTVFDIDTGESVEFVRREIKKQ